MLQTFSTQSLCPDGRHLLVRLSRVHEIVSGMVCFPLLLIRAHEHIVPVSKVFVGTVETLNMMNLSEVGVEFSWRVT